MSLIVRTVTRWVLSFIFVYGVYTVVYGHLTPGGGFPGGVILASGFVLLVLAWGSRQAFAVFGYGSARRLDSVGALVFLGLAVLGLVVPGALFFANVIQKSAPGEPLALWSGGIVPFCNLAMGLKVAASLFLVAVVLSALRVKAGGSESDFESLEE